MFERVPYVPEIANVIYLAMFISILFVVLSYVYSWYKSKKPCKKE